MIKKLIEKITESKFVVSVMTSFYLASAGVVSVSAVAKPNTSEAKNLIKPWITAGVEIVQWAAVGMGILYVGRVGLNYLQATEDERQRMNVWGNVKKGIIIVIIIESLIELFKVFGLNYSM